MVVKLNNLLINLSAFILLVSCSVHAEKKAPLENKVLSQAKIVLVKAQNKLDITISECRENLPLISPSKFDSTLEGSVLYTIIFHLSDKAIFNCESLVWGEYLVSLGNLRAIEDHLKIPLTKKTDYELLLFENTWNRKNLELKYNELNKNITQKYESNEIFLKPFNAVKTTNALGI